MAFRPPRSKKRSVANSPSKPPESITFFFDRSLSKKSAAVFRETGVQVEIHDDHFPPNAKDQDWLSVVGERGWFVITNDQRIRYRTIERNALIHAGVGAFVLTSGNLTGEEMGQTLVKALPKIRRFIIKHSRPFISRVTRSGELSVLDD